jgi:hypothetical protein
MKKLRKDIMNMGIADMGLGAMTTAVGAVGGPASSMSGFGSAMPMMATASGAGAVFRSLNSFQPRKVRKKRR